MATRSGASSSLGGVYGDVVIDWLFYSVCIPLCPIAIALVILFVYEQPISLENLLRDGVLLAYAATLAPNTMRLFLLRSGAQATGRLWRLCQGTGSLIIVVAATGFAAVTLPRVLGTSVFVLLPSPERISILSSVIGSFAAAYDLTFAVAARRLTFSLAGGSVSGS